MGVCEHDWNGLVVQVRARTAISGKGEKAAEEECTWGQTNGCRAGVREGTGRTEREKAEREDLRVCVCGCVRKIK